MYSCESPLVIRWASCLKRDVIDDVDSSGLFEDALLGLFGLDIEEDFVVIDSF